MSWMLALLAKHLLQAALNEQQCIAFINHN